MSQIVEFESASGISQTAELFSQFSDTVVATASATTESTHRLGTFNATFAGVSIGVYKLKSFLSNGYPIATYAFVNITSASGTFLALDTPFANPTNLLATNSDGSVNIDSASIQVNIVIPPAVAQNSQTPGMITIVRGDQLSVELPVLGTITGYTKLVCTAKMPGQIMTATNTDAQAVFQVQAGVGLVVLNGASTGITASDASLTVSSTITGATTLVLNAAVTKVIPLEDLVFDVQYWDAGAQPHTPVSGTIEIAADVTQST